MKLTAIVERVTTTDNGFGGVVETWSENVQVEGVLDTLSGDEMLSSDKETLYSTHVFICPVIDVIEADRMIIKGKIYQVKFVDNPLNKNIHLEVMLELNGHV